MNRLEDANMSANGGEVGLIWHGMVALALISDTIDQASLLE